MSQKALEVNQYLLQNRSFAKYEQEFSKGSVIFNSNETTTEMYFILNGKVKITNKVYDKVQTLAVLARGDFFGEMSTFTELPRIATATAIEDSRLLVVHPDTFLEWIDDNPDFALTVIKTLCRRLNKTDSHVQFLLFQSQLEKVSSVLYNIVTKGGEVPIKNKVVLNFNETLNNIMKQTGFSEEVVLSLLAHLVKNKKIDFTEENKVFSIAVYEKLERQAPA